jgi:hypothetical protein
MRKKISIIIGIVISTILIAHISALSLSNEAFALLGQIRTGGTRTSPVHTVPVQVHTVPTRVTAIPLWHTKHGMKTNPPKVVLKHITREPTLRGWHHAVLRGGTPKFGENFNAGGLLGKPAGDVGYRPSSTPKFGENFNAGGLLGKPASNSGIVQVAGVPNQTPVVIVTIPTAVTTWVLAHEPQLGDVNIPTAVTTWVLAHEPQLGDVNIPTAITTGNVNITPTEIANLQWYMHTLAITGDQTARVTAALQYWTDIPKAGKPLITYALENAWVAKIDIAGMKAGASEVVMETVELMCDAILMQPAS